MTDTLPDRQQRPADEQPSYETGGLRLALLVGSLVALGVLAGWAWVAIILGVVVMIFLHERLATSSPPSGRARR